MSGSDHVILVHGTWAQPRPGVVPWYVRTDGEHARTFADRLQAALAGTCLEESIDRASSVMGGEFSWSGANVHRDRIDGGHGLLSALRKIGLSDPRARIHVVAHSHGGNLVLRALSLARQVRPTELARVEWGGFVFMGTPFLSKRWSPGPVRFLADALLSIFRLALVPLEVVGRLVRADRARLITVAVLGTVALSIALMSGAVELSSLDFRLGTRSRAAPTVLIACLFVLAAGAAIYLALWILGLIHDLATALREATVSRRVDTNLYYFHRHAHERPRCLVLHAGPLDEALLGMTLSPLVATEILPRLQSMLRPPLFGRNSAPSGERPSALRRLLRLAGGSFGVIAAVALRALWILGPSRFLLSMLRAAMLRAVQSAALGLDVSEFRNARVLVTSTPDDISLPLQSVDVSRALAEMAGQRSPAGAEPEKSGGRFSFLWDPEESSRRSASSALWRRVNAADPLGRGAPEDVSDFILAFEERGRELIGSVEMYHSQYYDNERILQLVRAHLLSSASRG